MVSNQVFMSTVFIAGLLSFFAPCIVPLLPVYVSHLSVNLAGGESKTFKILGLTLHPMLIFKTFIFVSGISTTFIILGFGAGALGSVINTTWFIRICGVIVIILGIHQTGLIHLKFLEREKRIELKRSKRQDMLGTYLLGLTFSFGWTPCIGPVLGAVLGLSASEGHAIYGAWLMFIYALGLMIPFMIMAVFSDIVLSKIKNLRKHMGKIKIAGGVIIILMGILLMTDQLNTFTVVIENLK